MIKSIKIKETKIVYVNISLKEYIQDHAQFNLYKPINKQWAEIYKLPEGKDIIYIYNESYDSGTGDCVENDAGFLILHDDEIVNDRYADLKQFCLANLERIIHADPYER